MRFFRRRVNTKRMRMVRRAMLWSSLIGLFASVYLLITYTTDAPIVCGIVSGCELVRASKWAYSFGIPRPLLGVVFYLFVIALLVIRVYSPKHRPKFWTTLTILAAGIGFFESAFLTFVQTYDIHAYCIWCLSSAAAATVLFALSWFEGEEELGGKDAIAELKFIFLSFIAYVAVGGAGLFFLLK